jgi:preprotein translocase SecE subunit
MSKDDAAWVNVAYVVFFLLSSFVFFKAFETAGVQTGWSERFEWYGPAQVAIGLLLGGAVTALLRKDQEKYEYFLASIGELRKVTWPSWPDTKRMTIVVCVVVGIFAVIVSIFDLFWAKALKLLLA